MSVVFDQRELGRARKNMSDKKFEKQMESFEIWFNNNDLKEGFDLKTARDEWLDPDPRMRWLCKAILKQSTGMLCGGLDLLPLRSRG